MNDLLFSLYGNDSTLKVFWWIAIISSLVFIIQFILTLVGLDHSDVDIDVNTDVSGDVDMGMNLFSIKNLIGFLVGFGWTGVCLRTNISSNFWLVTTATTVGCLFVAMFVLIYKQARRLDKNGAFNIYECQDKPASTYLRVPAQRQGKGKVQISINGTVHELAAITDGDQIPSGQNVTILEIIDNETVRV